MEAMLDTMRTEAEVLLHCAFLLCYQIDLDRGGGGGGGGGWPIGVST